MQGIVKFVVSVTAIVGMASIATAVMPSTTHAAACVDQTFSRSSVKKTCVKYIQTLSNGVRLNNRAFSGKFFSPLKSDGVYGSATVNAIKDIQGPSYIVSKDGKRVTQLKRSGSVGRMTWAMLCTFGEGYNANTKRAANAAGCNGSFKDGSKYYGRRYFYHGMGPA